MHRRRTCGGSGGHLSLSLLARGSVEPGGEQSPAHLLREVFSVGAFGHVVELVGVGYRAALAGKDLELSLGYSHPIVYKAPAGVTFAVPKPTEIKITGKDKQELGQICSEIRKYRPPEPYKGKGVRYAGETVRRKEGKKK